MVNLHEFLVSGGQVGDFILHRYRCAKRRNPDRAPVFQHVAEQRRFPDHAPDDDFIIDDLRAHLLRRQGMIPPMERMPFPVVPVGGPGRTQAAGIKQTAREGIHKLVFIRRDHGGAVVPVLAHPAHVDALIPALPDVQPRVRQDIQFQAARCFYLDDLRAFGFTLRHGHAAQGNQLTRMADIALLDFIRNTHHAFS